AVLTPPPREKTDGTRGAAVFTRRSDSPDKKPAGPWKQRQRSRPPVEDPAFRRGLLHVAANTPGRRPTAAGRTREVGVRTAGKRPGNTRERAGSTGADRFSEKFDSIFTYKARTKGGNRGTEDDCPTHRRPRRLRGRRDRHLRHRRGDLRDRPVRRPRRGPARHLRGVREGRTQGHQPAPPQGPGRA